MNSGDIVEIELKNGHRLCVEVFDPLYPYPKEISMCIRDSTGMVTQDIACVRERYGGNGQIEVLVWADCDDECYTNEFRIPEHTFEP